jgi:hypothetical protein
MAGERAVAQDAAASVDQRAARRGAGRLDAATEQRLTSSGRVVRDRCGGRALRRRLRGRSQARLPPRAGQRAAAPPHPGRAPARRRLLSRSRVRTGISAADAPGRRSRSGVRRANPVARGAVRSTTRGVTIGTSLFLIAVGAILKYAVTAHVEGVDIQTVGVILMVVGVLGLILGLYLLMRGRWSAPGPPEVR